MQSRMPPWYPLLLARKLADTRFRLRLQVRTTKPIAHHPHYHLRCPNPSPQASPRLLCRTRGQSGQGPCPRTKMSPSLSGKRTGWVSSAGRGKRNAPTPTPLHFSMAQHSMPPSPPLPVWIHEPTICCIAAGCPCRCGRCSWLHVAKRIWKRLCDERTGNVHSILTRPGGGEEKMLGTPTLPLCPCMPSMACLERFPPRSPSARRKRAHPTRCRRRHHQQSRWVLCLRPLPGPGSWSRLSPGLVNSVILCASCRAAPPPSYSPPIIPLVFPFFPCLGPSVRTIDACNQAHVCWTGN